MNAEGGSSNFRFSTRDSHSALHASIRLVRGARRPRTDFFLRAESLFTAATYLEELAAVDGRALAPYGGGSLHEKSHGESFLAVMINRFGPHGLYLLDEPEAALSTQNCLTCLRRMHELVGEGSQLLIATHSPILLAYPGATIYSCGEHGLEQVSYGDAGRRNRSPEGTHLRFPPPAGRSSPARPRRPWLTARRARSLRASDPAPSASQMSNPLRTLHIRTETRTLGL
jgi:predicted ATPase